MAISSDKYTDLRRRLEADRDRLEAEIAYLHQNMARYIEAGHDLDSGFGNHMADEATETFDQERELALQRNLETVLANVRDALERMEKGTYGICDVCGQEIPIERLEARPYATRCVQDQAREDRRR